MFFTFTNCSCPIWSFISPQSIQRSRVPSVAFHWRSHSAFVAGVAFTSNCTQGTPIMLSVVAPLSVTDWRVSVSGTMFISLRVNSLVPLL
jgi:hypothetical protein